MSMFPNARNFQINGGEFHAHQHWQGQSGMYVLGQYN
jgi:hypothetical protein